MKRFNKSITAHISVILMILFLCPAYAVAGTFTFAAYGDDREDKGASDFRGIILDRIKKESPAFIIHTGDMVAKGDDDALWASFFRDFQARFKKSQLKPAKGNHDKSKNKRFESYFPCGVNGAAYYAFKYGGACFISIDSTEDYSEGSAQYKFIADELEKCRAKWPLVVYLHRPPFSAGEHGDTKKVRELLVPLFEKYEVDMVLSGHDHTYQRFSPKNGVTYIVTGGGGATLYDITSRKDLAASAKKHHYMVFRVEGNRLTAKAKDVNGNVIDEFVINK